MSDLVFDVFFDFFAVFSSRTMYIYCSTLLNHAAERPEKTVGTKMAVFRPFPRGKKVFGKKSQNKISQIIKMGYILT